MKRNMEHNKSKGALGSLAKKVEHKSGKEEYILAHFNPEEIELFDKLQGGARFNPKTNLREYYELDKTFDSPHIKKRLHHALMHPDDKKYARGGAVTGVKKLEHAGRNGDTMLAHITKKQAQVLDHLQGGTHFNPRTGLREYGFFKKLARSINKTVHQPGRRLVKPVVRIAAPVVGGMIGGPAGAAAGGFLGNKVTGGRTKDALKAGLLSGVGAYLLPQIGGQFAQTFPGASGALEGLSNTVFGPGITSSLGQALTGGAGSNIPGLLGGAGSRAAGEVGRNILTGGVSGAGEIGRNILTGGGGALASQAVGQAAGRGLGGGLGGLISAPTLAMGGLGLMSILSQKKQQKKERDRYNQEIAAIEGGPNTLNPTNMRTPYYAGRDFIPYTGGYSPFEEDQPHQFFSDLNPLPQYHAQGGSVHPNTPKYFEGPGGGQDDDIPTVAEEGGFYIPADVMSGLGDGNSKMGALKFNHFLSQRPTSPTYSKGGKAKIPAMVSAGEYYIPPHDVDKLGKGSNKKGTSKLEKLLKTVRSHKSTKSHPPKAKTISEYMKLGRA